MSIFNRIFFLLLQINVMAFRNITRFADAGSEKQVNFIYNFCTSGNFRNKAYPFCVVYEIFIVAVSLKNRCFRITGLRHNRNECQSQVYNKICQSPIPFLFPVKYKPRYYSCPIALSPLNPHPRITPCPLLTLADNFI